jgi:mannosyl-3-phosphoglycerate phosphatase
MSNITLMKNIVIFSDLDGTLLDHHTYNFTPAVPMLGILKKFDIPLIIVTSKTKKEVIRLQQLLEIDHPFIIENGAGIIIPKDDDYEVIALGYGYDYVREAFERYAKVVDMRGFYEMSLDEIIEYTELPQQQALDAKARLFTEPFILNDPSKLETLELMAEQDDLEIVKGGRFYHLITKGQDKAKAIEKMRRYFEDKRDDDFQTIALGDSYNDLSMLKSVDIPVLIPHPDGSFMPCQIPNLIRAPFPGPKGWNITLKALFDV